MNEAHRAALLEPMVVGVIAFICTVLIHAVPLSSTVRFVSREKQRGHVGVSFWLDTAIAGAISFALAAHLVEMALWALLFMVCGEFADLVPPTTTRPSTTHPWAMATLS